MSYAVSYASASELCLRYPENVGIHAQISYEQAIGLLTQAVDLTHRVPFAWAYIDKPPDGQAYLIFIVPRTPHVPPDGIRWLDQEKTYRLPVPNGRELEVSEVKYGFVPNGEASASRIRRRFRLVKGGNSQLMLVHYLRGDTATVPAHLLSAAVRSYPLRPTNEPRVFVSGERIGQRVPHNGPTSLPAASSSPHPAHGVNMGLGLGIGAMNQAAALAQRNQAMDVLERERGVGGIASMPGGAARPPEEDDSGEEYENVSTRTLAIERFKRNHELMAEVFTYASKGHRAIPTVVSPYASLDISELDGKMTKLTAEIEVLKARAEERRIVREAAKVAEMPEDMETTPVMA
ncbi:hypothetical protein JB92DRAFT_3089528 [Gautieria morchelliformis]|nr:hypothetical protein JB92DRAFT_3089528 [Gautieria morchelliformis]